jgi:putative YhbY family RNA-binding protein
MAKAHALHPVVIVGHNGLTDAVMREIDASLRAHELIKVRVVGDDRLARSAALDRICAELDAAAVQQVGKLLVLWRPAPPPETPAPAAAARKSFTTKRGRPAAKKSPRAAPKGAKPAQTGRRRPPPGPSAGAQSAPTGVRARRRRGQT